MKQEQVKEIGDNIRLALSNWSYILLEMDCPQDDGTCISQNVRMQKEDVINACHIFSSIISNYVLHETDLSSLSEDGIKATTARQIEMGDKLHRLMLDYSGINTKTFFKS